MEIYPDVKRRGIYLTLFTDPEGNSYFSIYQISWIKMKKSNFLQIKNVTWSTAFLRFCCKFSMKIIFHLPVKNGKSKIVDFLVFVCTTASISSIENISKRDAILAPVSNQRIAKDIPSYKSQSNRVKIGIH